MHDEHMRASEQVQVQVSIEQTRNRRMNNVRVICMHDIIKCMNACNVYVNVCIFVFVGICLHAGMYDLYYPCACLHVCVCVMQICMMCACMCLCLCT